MASEILWHTPFHIVSLFAVTILSLFVLFIFVYSFQVFFISILHNFSKLRFTRTAHIFIFKNWHFNPPVQHFCLFTCSVLTNVVFITVSLQLLDEGKNGQEESAYQQARPSCGIGSISSQTCKWTCCISILNILKIMSFCSIADPGIIKNSFLKSCLVWLTQVSRSELWKNNFLFRT